MEASILFLTKYCPWQLLPTILLPIAELVEMMAIRSLGGIFITPYLSTLFASKRPISKIHLCNALLIIYYGILHTIIH